MVYLRVFAERKTLTAQDVVYNNSERNKYNQGRSLCAFICPIIFLTEPWGKFWGHTSSFVSLCSRMLPIPYQGIGCGESSKFFQFELLL